MRQCLVIFAERQLEHPQPPVGRRLARVVRQRLPKLSQPPAQVHPPPHRILDELV